MYEVLLPAIGGLIGIGSSAWLATLAYRLHGTGKIRGLWLVASLPPLIFGLTMAYFAISVAR